MPETLESMLPEDDMAIDAVEEAYSLKSKIYMNVL